MGLFSSYVTDEDWLVQIKPLYKELTVVANTLSELIENKPLPDNGDVILHNAHNQLTVISKSIKQSPKPTSREARQVMKNLESSINDYIEGTKTGISFYRGMASELGDIYRSGVGLNKLAEATLGGILKNFLKSINRAQHYMGETKSYFLDK